MVLMVMGYRLDTVEMQGHWVSAVKKKKRDRVYFYFMRFGNKNFMFLSLLLEEKEGN